MLPRRVREAIYLNVSGKPMFHAQLVRSGSKRGARIEERVPQFPPPQRLARHPLKYWSVYLQVRSEPSGRTANAAPT